MSAFSNDQYYRRAKDVALFVLAVISMYSWVVRPATINEKIHNTLSSLEDTRNKYVPVVENNAFRITKLETRQEEQFNRIMSELQAINRKLER